MVLPPPNYTGLSVEEAIAERRSVREYSNEGISLQELSQILWAAQGITDEGGKRAAPSAGALYPIELYIVPSRIEGLSCGIYHYVPSGHKLVLFKEGNFSEGVYHASNGQQHVRDAAAVIIFTAVRERTAQKYGESADTLIAMEAGHISENILLQSVSLDLGAVPVGGFDQGALDQLLGINGTGESSLYLNCIGGT
ncbi:SagB/ThcOx family dehydrogenase [Candidatus Micrarchaeota archaeon]|nr:SagB/ThcOx family dehydrogenase [Candidatus Micrarchaeota archaeon]